MVAFRNKLHIVSCSDDHHVNQGLNDLSKKHLQDVNTPGSPALTRVYAWFSAVVSDDVTLMEDLLTHGLSVDVPHPLRHTTALMEATRLGRTALVAWLLEHGATPAFLCGLPRGTPLHGALKRHHWDIADLLVAATPTCGVVDNYSRTPLHALAMDMPHDAEGQGRALTVAAALIPKGCQMDALDHEGITALHYCVINDCGSLAQLLLEHGANPNTLTPDTHVSPLTIAAYEKNAAMAQLLMEYGANPQLPTREGATAFTIMPSLKRMEVTDRRNATGEKSAPEQNATSSRTLN